MTREVEGGDRFFRHAENIMSSYRTTHRSFDASREALGVRTIRRDRARLTFRDRSDARRGCPGVITPAFFPLVAQTTTATPRTHARPPRGGGMNSANARDAATTPSRSRDDCNNIVR